MKKLLAAITLCALGMPVHAYDPARVADHVRKALNLDTRTEIIVDTAATPAPFGDLKVITVRVGGAPYPIYMAKDESQYIWGQTMDLRVDPDADRAARIKLEGAHAIGFKSAPVTVVEYSDFECSFCRNAHKTIKDQLYKTYTKSQVRLVFKHFPLNMHPWAEKAAVATECAAVQKADAFWSMSDMIFENSPRISTATINNNLMQYAAALKLDIGAFRSCVEGNATIARVQADKKEGMAVGVGSTPTLFVNGRLRRGFRDFDDLKVVIDEKLKALKK